MIRIGICDDTKQDLHRLEEYVLWFSEKHPEYPLKAETFTSSYDILDALEERGGYDLYLLDIIMPFLNGIDVAKRVRKRGETTKTLKLTKPLTASF